MRNAARFLFSQAPSEGNIGAQKEKKGRAPAVRERLAPEFKAVFLSPVRFI